MLVTQNNVKFFSVMKRGRILINTVLGQVNESEINSVLCHEHICCYSEYLKLLSGNKTVDEKEVVKAAVGQLKELKEKYGMNLFVDCTPVNIGRNIGLLKTVSEKSGVHIVCSTGFYYGEEPILLRTCEETLTEYYLNDIKECNSGIIKAAVEHENLTPLNEKLLWVCAKTHLKTGLPIVLHTNAKNQNGLKALEKLLSLGVKPCEVTVGHLSDTEDADYIKQIASYGCYVGLDRLHPDTTEEYINTKLKTINGLIDAGFLEKILLSHDALIYSEFDALPKISYASTYNYVFDSILSRLDKDVSDTIIKKNPVRMLGCK